MSNLVRNICFYSQIIRGTHLLDVEKHASHYGFSHLTASLNVFDKAAAHSRYNSRRPFQHLLSDPLLID